MFEMLAWEGGNFSTERGKRSPKETIIKGWQSLLLEGMRRVDEAKPGRADMNREIAKAQQDTTLLLEKIISLKGVILATVFDPEGFPVASQINDFNKEKFRIQEITPMISTLLPNFPIRLLSPVAH